MTSLAKPLEYDFTAAVITDARLRTDTRSALRQILHEHGVFDGDPRRVEELLTLTDTYQVHACPFRVDEESLLIGGLYGMIIILHGTGIITGDHLELTPEAFARHLQTGRVDKAEPPESARLLADLGRRLMARRAQPEALCGFVHYATRTYRAYRDKRQDVLMGRQVTSLAAYLRNREFRIGIYPWAWLWIALGELGNPRKIARDDHLRQMLRLANQITYMRNDIATLNRDVHDGIENYILLLEAQLQCSRAHAIALTGQRCNDRVEQFLQLERVVVSLPREYPPPEVRDYIGFLKSVLVGNLLALDAFGSTEYVNRDTLAS